MKQLLLLYMICQAGLLTTAQTTAAKRTVANKTAVPVAAPVSYQFTTTNFDDGWTATAGQEWTTLSKGAIRVLVHYPLQQTDQYNADKLQGDHHAWNTLVAPRYEQLENFVEAGIQDYESITFFMGDVRDKATGRKVFVVLYKKHYDKGNGRYLEVVSPSKAAFEQEFGNNYINRSSWEYTAQIKSWNKLADMQGRNRFAVAASDLTGKWSSSTYESLTYYYTSGGYTSSTATATSIADEYLFQAGGNYQSDHAGASGVVGNQRFARQVYKGKFNVSNWEMALTNRFEGATENYACYFEPVRGGRILVMTDRNKTTISLVRQQ